MTSRLNLSPRASLWLILALLALFVGLGYRTYSEDTGDDLSASYLGCRLLASGQGAHLYAHDPNDFAAVGDDDAWQAAADQTHFDSWLHPYVQTPLWAWSLQPLCTRVDFPTFDRLFTLATLASFAALLCLVARVWAPRLLHPAPFAVMLAALWFSTPFQYAMLLMQTHIFFVLLTILAIDLAVRRPLLAGTLLALAVAVKLTPAIFLLYWLLTRRYRAAATFVLVFTLLFIAARVTTGPTLFAEYLGTLHRASHTLLISQNNQSLAATWMTRFYPASEAALVRSLPLPAALRIAGDVLLLLSALLAGLLDRSPHRSPHVAPLGALSLLIAATLFTPIAWTHYFIVLIPALMVLADIALRRRSLSIALATLAILTLNLPPLASNVIDLTIGPHAILRSQFFSGLLALVTLAFAAQTSRRYIATRPTLT